MSMFKLFSLLKSRKKSIYLVSKITSSTRHIYKNKSRTKELHYNGTRDGDIAVNPQICRKNAKCSYRQDCAEPFIIFSRTSKGEFFTRERLRETATLAGFINSIFLIEPIAAALKREEIFSYDKPILVDEFNAGSSESWQYLDPRLGH